MIFETKQKTTLAVKSSPNVGQAEAGEEAEKNGQRTRNGRHQAPENNVVVFDLHVVGVKPLYVQSFRYPQRDIDQNQQRNERSGWFGHFHVLVFGPHIRGFDNQNSLTCAL